MARLSVSYSVVHAPGRRVPRLAMLARQFLASAHRSAAFMGSLAHRLFVYGDDLLCHNRVLQVSDIGSPGRRPTVEQGLFKRCRKGVGVAGAYFTTPGATNNLGDIAHVRGDNGYVACHRFFDDIRRSLVDRWEHDDVA